MENNDIFKIVEEMERQKAKDVDEVFSQLDSLGTGNAVISEIYQQKQREYESAIEANTYTVTKPKFPNYPGEYDTRFDCFKQFIGKVDYGTNNSPEYVRGHSEALKKYYELAYNNSKNLYVVEAGVKEEVGRIGEKNTLYIKGYYDGLVYVLRAIHTSRDLLIDKVGKTLKAILK